MKRLAVLSLVVLVAALVFAQTKAEPKYDKAAEVTLKGTIEDMKDVPGTCCKDACLHLMLRTEKGLFEVQVAPEAFLKEMDVKFEKGDKIEVKAAKMTRNDADVYLAREITRNGNVLVVRDNQGGPVWTFIVKG
jgi:hypothetical protein